MGDFEEFGFDFNLGGAGGGGSFDQGIDQIEVGLGVFDDEAAGAGDEIGAGPVWKSNSLPLERFFSQGAAGDTTWSRRSTGSGLNKAGRDFVFLGDEDIGVFRLGDDDDGVGLDLELEVGGPGDVIEGGPEGNIGEREGDGECVVGRVGRELEDDVDAFGGGVGFGVVEFGGAFFDEVEGFADGGIGEVDAGNDDGIEFIADELGASDGDLGLLDDGGGAVGEFAEGEFPGFRDLHEHVAAGFVVGGVGVLLAGEVDFFHQLAGGDVVFVNIEGLFAAFEGEVVAAGGEEAFAFFDEFLDFLDFGDMAGGEGAAIDEALGIEEAGAEGEGGAVVWIVAFLEDDFDEGFGIGIAAFGDALAGELDGGIAEAGEGLLADIGGGGTAGREGIDGALEMGIGGLVVEGGHFLLAFGDLGIGVGFFLVAEGLFALGGADDSGILAMGGAGEGEREGKGGEPEWLGRHLVKKNQGAWVSIIKTLEVWPVARSCIWAESRVMSMSLNLAGSGGMVNSSPFLRVNVSPVSWLRNSPKEVGSSSSLL